MQIQLNERKGMHQKWNFRLVQNVDYPDKDNETIKLTTNELKN